MVISADNNLSRHCSIDSEDAPESQQVVKNGYESNFTVSSANSSLSWYLSSSKRNPLKAYDLIQFGTLGEEESKRRVYVPYMCSTEDFKMTSDASHVLACAANFCIVDTTWGIHLHNMSLVKKSMKVRWCFWMEEECHTKLGNTLMMWRLEE